jgi:hypothetical protein
MDLPIEMQVEELITQSRRAPRGPTAIALAEEAVRLADTSRDVALGVLARERLIDAAAYGGQSLKLIVAFTWILAQCDKDPERFHEAEYFWKFKWFAEHLAEFPEIPKDRLFALFDDMAARYERHGYSLRPVHKVRCNACVEMGDIEGARHWFMKWQQTEMDWNNDCAACEADSKGRFQLALGDYKGAMQTFRPIVDTRRMRCAEVPHVTFAQVSLPTLRDGAEEKAVGYQEAGYRMVRNNPDFIRQVGMHIEFAAEHGDVDEGLKMFERHAVWYTHSGSPLEHFTFLLGVRKLIAKAKQRSRQETRKLRFPRALPFWQQDGNYRWDDLLTWADTELDRLAAAFDARNGNDHYTRQVDEARA